MKGDARREQKAMRLAPKERRQTRAGKAVAFTKGTKVPEREEVKQYESTYD